MLVRFHGFIVFILSCQVNDFIKDYYLQVIEDAQVDQKDDGPVEWISYWKPNITINLVDDFTR